MYEYSTRVLRFKTKVYYDNGEQFIPSNVIGFDQKSIPLDKAGTYNLSSVVVLPTGSTFFCLTVTVKEGPDERPVPVIEILPDDKCIEYELNKRYVYKYDGEFHLPERFTVYDCTHMNEDGSVDRFPIGSYLTYKFAYEMKIVEGSTDNSAYRCGYIQV